MGCKVIHVRPLSEEESLILFLNKVGPNIVQNANIMPTLKLVVNECAGLPLTIVVVAATLKGEDHPLIWKNALKELKIRIGMVEGVEAKVIARLKFSFNHLEDEKVKCYLLYCLLYPEDFEIEKDKLIECWIDEGYIDEMDTRNEMKDKGHAVLKMLEDNCLLENVISRKHDLPCVKMHDAVRDMALSITSMNSRYMIQAGMQLEKLPKEEEWGADIEKVLLMENYISDIPEDMSPPNCQLLTTLLLQLNSIKKIPNALFVKMPHLSVLNLSCTFIKSLPHSISELKHLTVLLLGYCRLLRHLPSLSKLQGLKKLDLYDTSIEEIPQGMDMLVNLRYLDLQVFSLKDMPRGLLPKLSDLQHLRFDLYFAKTMLKAEEVVPLEKLECFEGRFQDMHEFNKFVCSMQRSRKNLINYLLQVGPTKSVLKTERDKKVRINEIKCCEGELIMLPFDVQDLQIFACQDLRSLNNYIPSLENMIDLRVCRIMNCEEMECVVSFSFSSSRTQPFQYLEKLYLDELPMLSELIKVERFDSAATSQILTPSATFSLLKVINIECCRSMKTLLPHWLLSNLQNLEKVHVALCDQLTEILGAPTSEDEENGSDTFIKFIFPKLRKLTLLALPELENICSKNGVMVCDSLRLITIDRCFNLKRIPPFVPLVGNGQPYAYAPPSLEHIQSNTEWWELLQWDDPNFKNAL